MVAVNFESVLSNQLGWAGFERAMQLPTGYASALFVVLAGIGITFLSGKEPKRGRLVLVRRALVLLILGYNFLFWAWEQDILHFYGYYFLFAIPLLGVRSRLLLLVAALVLLPTPMLLQAGFDFDRGWVLDRLEYVDMWTARGHLRHLFINGFFPLAPWMAFVLWGMWLGRRLSHERDYARRIAPRALALFLLAQLVSRALTARLGPLFGAESMPPLPLYVISAAALATAVIGLGEWITERFPSVALVRALVHTGQLALSIYLLHVIVGIGPFDVWFQLGCLSRSQVFAWWAIFCYLAVLGAHLWRLRFAQGPFEALYRAIGGSVEER